MLTRTTISAISALVHLGLHGEGRPLSPRRMAARLGASPSYLAKVMRLLVRAGILRARFGAAGGVVLARPPETITLLAIIEACEGAVLADLCTETDDLSAVCGFHQAGAELHQAVVGVMSRWTLADFLRRPTPTPKCAGKIRCWMQAASKSPPAPGRRPARGKNAAMKTGRSA